MADRKCSRCGAERVHARGLCPRCYRIPAARRAAPVRDWRPWTARERETLRSLWGRVPAAAIAERLGRPETGVRGAAQRFCRVRRHKRLDDYGPRIERLHAEGRTNGEIARELGLSSASLHCWMRRRGLKANGKRREVFRRVKREEYARVWARRGDSLTDARVTVHAAEAARRGWPQARSPRQADYLDALETGPKSGRELAALLGVPWSRKLGGCAVTGMLRQLARAGLVVSAKSPADRRVVVYRLADGVRRHTVTRGRGEGPVPPMSPRGEGVPARTARVAI